eukprot:COSAG01_NODE_734_length_13974_cov_57.831784_11_plen_64_part_00
MRLFRLGNLHGPAIIDNLRLRFNNKGGRAKAIYTYCGNICIAGEARSTYVSHAVAIVLAPVSC